MQTFVIHMPRLDSVISGRVGISHSQHGFVIMYSFRSVVRVYLQSETWQTYGLRYS